MSTQENRARVLKAALEALKAQTERLIEQMDLEIAPYDETKADDMHAVTTLFDFDDALVVVADARNEFVEAAELETENLTLNWKVAK